jgi:hypothetical protein
MWKALFVRRRKAYRGKIESLPGTLLLQLAMSKKIDTGKAANGAARGYCRRWYKVIAFKIARILEANRGID